ncbi:hypothetical protein [Anaerostipes faecalis]|uniref:hypothetical protein n=1 Tax=Anaerostipes faecalis TaxID=2738446 RepID=UPI003F0D3F48
MDFDLRTCDAAYYFVLDFMGMTPDEYITERIINCENDFETFWSRNIERIKSVDITGLRLMAFHVVGSLDGCREIKEKGLMNLQAVLSEETTLKKLLERVGVTFDIANKLVSCKGNSYDIDYEKYRNHHFLTGLDEKLDRVAHRVYYDFYVNGFMANDNVYNYGTNIHERPEFLMTLGELFPQAQIVESYWRSKAKSYRVDFFATVDQVHRFNFELDEYRDPPYEGWDELDDEMKLKKWVLSHAIDRAHNDLGMTILYIKDDVTIPTNQITSISEL